MSTRDDLLKALAPHAHVYDSDCGIDLGCNCGETDDYDEPEQDHNEHLADALIAEGWRKKPSRTQLARVIDKAQADFLREDLPEDGRTEKATIADAVLALMDRGQ